MHFSWHKFIVNPKVLNPSGLELYKNLPPFNSSKEFDKYKPKPVDNPSDF